MIYIFNFFLSVVFFLANYNLYKKNKKFIFFIFYGCLYFLYVHISPTIYSEYDETIYDKSDYIIIQLKYFIFFYIPTVFLTVILSQSSILKKILSKRKIKIYSFPILTKFIYIIIPIYFLIISIKNGIFYKRLGLELTDRISQLNNLDLIVYQLFTSTYIVLIILFLRNYLNKKLKFFHVPTIIVGFTYALINSKLELLIIFLGLFCTLIYDNKFRFRLNYVMYALFILLSIKTVNNFRYSVSFVNKELVIDYKKLNPFNTNKIDTSDNENIFVRTNGVFFEYKINNSNFKSNTTEYLNHVFKIFPVIGDSQYLKAQKAYGTTSGKMFLWNKAFGLQKSDIYSCLLSEYSVGLGIIGILFCSLIISFLKSISIVLFSLKNEIAFILGLVIAINMFYFELELYTLIKRIFLSFIITLPLISIKSKPQIVKHEK